MKPTHKKTILKRHAAMVDDPLRTPLIAEAIGKIVKKNHTVLEIGAGTGVLTLLALRSGAQKVYACEVDRSIQIAREKIRQAGFYKQVEFFNELSTDIDLPEPVDVLISETVGSLGFNENILYYVTQARDEHLKDDGKIIPNALSVHLAPTTHSIPDDKAGAAKGFITALIPSNSLLAAPQEYFGATLTKVKVLGFDLEKKFKIERPGTLHGMAGWVEVEWAPGIRTSASPFDPPTHWKQTFLPFSKPMRMKAGDELLFRLRVGPDPENPLESLIEWGYKQISKS